MSEIERKNSKDLLAMRALLLALRQTTAAAQKGPLLVDCFNRRPTVADIFRLVYDYRINFAVDACDIAFHGRAKVPDGYTQPPLYTLLERLVRADKSDPKAVRAFMCFLATIPDECCSILCDIVHKDLNCGVNLKLLNKALERAGCKPVVTPPTETQQLTIEFYQRSDVSNTWFAALLYGGSKVAHVDFNFDPAMRELSSQALQALRNAGVQVTSDKITQAK